MRRFAILLAGWLALAAAAGAAPFSQSLNPAERASCGLARLSPAQVAELDLLVQREAAVEAAAARPLPAFSHRLSADEFQAAGLGMLTADQRGRLDDLVERSWATVAESEVPPVPMTAEEPQSVPSSVAVAGPRPQVHGSVTLGYGWGSGGRSEKFGGMEMNYFDPTTGLGIAVGIAEEEGNLFRCWPGPAR